MPESVPPHELVKLAKLPPRKVIAFFKSKGYRISWDWREVWQQEHDRAFTVAKAAQREILDELRRGVTAALEQGWSERRFIREMTPKLQALGWWGQQTVINPSGALQLVQLGSPWRLKTIYRTNLYSSFARGRYAILAANKKNRPYWMYDAINDDLTRDSHRALDNHVYPAESKIWDTIYPPNGFNCRCMVRALTAEQVKAKGLEILDGGSAKLPKNFPDEGWNYNPAEQTIEQLASRIRPELRKPATLIPPPPVLPPATPATITPPAPVAPPPGAAKTVPLGSAAPESLELGGAPIKVAPWVAKFIKGGSFKLDGKVVAGSAKVEKLFSAFNHPADMGNVGGKGAAYSRQLRAIRMTGSKMPNKPDNRATFRHEMGHYIDHRLGDLKLKNKGLFYRSSLPDAQAAMLADRGRIKDMIGDTEAIRAKWKEAERVIEIKAIEAIKWVDGKGYRATISFRGVDYDIDMDELRALVPASEVSSITSAFHVYVHRAVAKTAEYQTALKLLQGGKNLISETYRRAVAAGFVFESSSVILWARAAELGDLSILFRYHNPITAIFNANGWDMGKFSDMVGAITNEDLAGWSWGSGGHGKNYYLNRVEKFAGGYVESGNGTEAFANLVDAMLYRHDPYYESLIKTVLPDYSTWFDEIIEDALNAYQ